MKNYPLFQEISDPVVRKRALADSIGAVIDEVIKARGMGAEDLESKLNYVRCAVREMQDI